jgi:hypothetical protein
MTGITAILRTETSISGIYCSLYLNIIFVTFVPRYLNFDTIVCWLMVLTSLDFVTCSFICRYFEIKPKVSDRNKCKIPGIFEMWEETQGKHFILRIKLILLKELKNKKCIV